MLTHAVEIPAFMRESRIIAELRGFAVVDAIPDPVTFDAMRAEAWEAYDTADRQECDTDDGEELRGGMPRRRLFSAGAGPAQDHFYHDLRLAQSLSDLCGVTVTRSGSRGSYSYYMSDGDCLDLHRDVETCDVTLITCLHDSSDPLSPVGALVVYPDRIAEPLSEIRARPDDGAVALKLMPGQSIVLLGGVVPHRVLPVVAGQARVISALCFLAEPVCIPCAAQAGAWARR
jgi:hypothetical protein